MEKKDTGDDQMHDLLGSTTGRRKRNKDDDQMRDLGPKVHAEGSLFHTREYTIDLNYKQRKKTTHTPFYSTSSQTISCNNELMKSRSTSTRKRFSQ
jgi:hypothetical protein